MNSPLSIAISRASRWTNFPADIQKYLQYHDEHITFYHYFLKFDIEDCIHTELIDLALTYEPLLYAVVAFSAYQHTLKQPGGQLNSFFTYYNKSINLLIESLAKGAKSTEATLLTIIQLATIEEYLGDWASLTGHHHAAYYMLSEIYSAERIMETEVHRVSLAWCSRFDLAVALTTDYETVLERKWYLACSNWYDDTEDVDVTNSLQYIIAQSRIVGLDIAALFSKHAEGGVNTGNFEIENAAITSRLQTLKSRIERYYGSPHGVTLAADDVVKLYVPGGLFNSILCSLPLCWCDWYGLSQIHKQQTSLALGIDMGADLEQLSFEQCRLYDAIERFPEAPQGFILAAHGSLAFVIVFLKADRHIMWARQRLALVENVGYVFRPTFRQILAQLWNMPELEHWWLPNEDGYSPILKEIRNLIEERITTAGKNSKGGDGNDLKYTKAHRLTHGCHQQR